MNDREVRAQQFTLVDGKGKVRAVLGFDYHDNPQLAFFDEESHRRVEIGFTTLGRDPIISLRSQEGQTVVELSANGPCLVFYSKDGKYLAELSNIGDSGTICSLRDAQSNLRVFINAMDGVIEVLSAEGKLIGKFPTQVSGVFEP
jgi:hypothetical protein